MGERPTDGELEPRPVLVKVSTAGRMLDRSSDTIRRMVHAGKLRGVRDNSQLMIPVTEIDAWVERLKRDQWNVTAGRRRTR